MLNNDDDDDDDSDDDSDSQIGVGGVISEVIIR